MILDRAAVRPSARPACGSWAPLARATLHGRHLKAATPQRSSRQARFHGRSTLKVSAIGFVFDEDDRRPSAAPPVKRGAKVAALGSLAASLLVYGGVVRGPVGEAFLAALAVTQKYQAGAKEVLSAYSRLYSLLLAAGYDSWQDYVLDQVLLGRDNAFARAVAQGTLAPGAPLLRAVAYDLDVLQELSLPLATVAEMVADAAPTAGPYWLEAATSLSIKAPHAPAPAAVEPVALDPHTKIPYIARPPSEAELAAWRAAIASRESWGEAVPLLQQFYHTHGFGITSRNSTLRWSKGAFEECLEAAPARPLPSLSALSEPAARLVANTAAHCEGRPAQHVLLAGPAGSGKSSLLWEHTLAAGRERGLRLVDVGPAELGALLEAARGCARYPRLRFVLAADHVEWPLRGTAAAELASGLGGAGPSGWPDNTLLYMGISSASTLSYDALSSRFGLLLTTRELEPEQWGATLRELAGEDAARLSEEDVAYAADWARKQCGGLSVRAAAQYVKRARAAG